MITLMWQVQGAMKLGRLAKALAADVNVRRRAKGLLPRAVSSSYIPSSFLFQISDFANLQQLVH